MKNGFLTLLSVIGIFLAISCTNEELMSSSEDTEESSVTDDSSEDGDIDEEEDTDDDETNTDDINSETRIEEEILVLINAHRAANNLSELQTNTTAYELAVDHNLYMIDQGAISHDNFSSRSSALQDEEDAINVGENVASGYNDAESVVNAWLNSTGHRENIEKNFTYTGIAVIKDSNNRNYFTQLFFR